MRFWAKKRCNFGQKKSAKLGIALTTPVLRTPNHGKYLFKIDLAMSVYICGKGNKFNGQDRIFLNTVPLLDRHLPLHTHPFITSLISKIKKRLEILSIKFKSCRWLFHIKPSRMLEKLNGRPKHDRRRHETRIQDGTEQMTYNPVSTIVETFQTGSR